MKKFICVNGTHYQCLRFVARKNLEDCSSMGQKPIHVMR